jgi:hypothetical protein
MLRATYAHFDICQPFDWLELVRVFDIEDATGICLSEPFVAHRHILDNMSAWSVPERNLVQTSHVRFASYAW